MTTHLRIINGTLYTDYVTREGLQVESCWQRVNAKGDGATVRELKMLVHWLHITKEQAIDLQDYARLRTLRGYERRVLERLTP